MTETPVDTQLGEHRCVNTVDMLALYATAKALDLDRNLEPATVAALDPRGVHVLTLILVDHRADESRGLPTHHRTSTLLKTNDSGKLLAVFLDVTDEHWRRMLTLREAETLPEYAAVTPGLPLNLPSRLSEKAETLEMVK